MLSEQLTELLTAYVDGELSPRQRKAVMRFLHKSSEAREFLRQLQENAHRLKQLPQHKVEPSLVDDIVRAIADQKAQPKPASSPRNRRRRWMPYVAASLAASVLAVVIGIVAWQAVEESNRPVENPAPIAKTPDKTQPDSVPVPVPRKMDELLARITRGTFDEASKPIVPERVFAAKFQDLRNEKGPVLTELSRELARDKTAQLEVTVKSNAQAMSRLKEVLKDRGITLVTDSATAKSLADKGQAKTEYLVFVENLSADEVSKLMRDLGQSYVMPGTANQKTVESPYKKVAVAPIEADSRQTVKRLLGIAEEPKQEWDPTAKRQAVVLPGSTDGTPSAEVRQFVSERRIPKPNTMQILLRIRQE